MTGAGGLAYERYETGGCAEWTMRIGAADAPALLFLPPLFEEMNRTRALIAATMRRVAAAGFACRLPDLPGTGESERALESCGWEDWLRAAADAAAGAVGIVGFRGGALLDAAAPPVPRWRFAPVDGASLARDLARAGLAAGGGSAGYAVGEGLIERLKGAVPVGEARVVRLESDRAEADRKVAGPALWRRSEPATSPELSELIASDIIEWARRCGD